jgi:hypothetical protein
VFLTQPVFLSGCLLCQYHQHDKLFIFYRYFFHLLCNETLYPVQNTTYFASLDKGVTQVEGLQRKYVFSLTNICVPLSSCKLAFTGTTIIMVPVSSLKVGSIAIVGAL